MAPAGMQGSPNTGSTMQWTIIRPGGLKSEPATGSGILTEDRSICGAINREDVAELVVKALFSDKADGKVRRSLILIVPDIDFTEDALIGKLRIMALSSQHCDINREDVRRTRGLTFIVSCRCWLQWTSHNCMGSPRLMCSSFSIWQHCSQAVCGKEHMQFLKLPVPSQYQSLSGTLPCKIDRKSVPKVQNRVVSLGLGIFQKIFRIANVFHRGLPWKRLEWFAHL